MNFLELCCELGHSCAQLRSAGLMRAASQLKLNLLVYEEARPGKGWLGPPPFLGGNQSEPEPPSKWPPQAGIRANKKLLINNKKLLLINKKLLIMCTLRSEQKGAPNTSQMWQKCNGH